MGYIDTTAVFDRALDRGFSSLREISFLDHAVRFHHKNSPKLRMASPAELFVQTKTVQKFLKFVEDVDNNVKIIGPYVSTSEKTKANGFTLRFSSSPLSVEDSFGNDDIILVDNTIDIFITSSGHLRITREYAGNDGWDIHQGPKQNVYFGDNIIEGLKALLDKLEGTGIVIDSFDKTVSDYSAAKDLLGSMRGQTHQPASSARVRCTPSGQ